MPGLRSALQARRRVPWRTVWIAALAIAPVIGVLLSGYERRWIHDDGFIDLRIVRNLLHGDGPVFNVDERVEAGTSPLWLGALAVLGGLGFRLEHAAVFAGIGLTGIGLIAAQWGAARLDSRLHSASGQAAQRPRPVLLPIGAAIVAALPPVWDYASSGLETGLGLAWLGLCYAVVACRIENGHTRARRDLLIAMSLGLGPLVRPELILYSAALFVPLAAATAVDAAPQGKSAVVAAVARAAAGVCAWPLAYQLFRMGYYGCLAPNTAIAKEAFLANWPQGRCYFDNFFGTYAMGWPLVAAGFFWVARLVRHFIARRRRALALAASLPIAAAIHVTYLVGIGGDYMHARLFVPAVFAALLPVMTAPLSLRMVPAARALLASSAAVIAVWATVCAAKLRVGRENVCGIGDERGWYVAEAGTHNPVALDAYRGHPFYEGATKALNRVQAACPSATRTPGPVRPCRRVYVDEDDSSVAPAPRDPVIADTVDARIDTVLSSGAIGIFGYLLPSTVHLVDRHGLADPVTARIELHDRGRPGHEKKVSAAWILARFAGPAAREDAAVGAARHALECGPLAVLERSVAAPLTARVVIDNFTHALANSRLRVPPDPFDAEARFCGTPTAREVAAGGGGGTFFRWRCPSDESLSGLRVAYKDDPGALSFVRALCRDARRPGTTLEGPGFGEPSRAVFDVECPGGSTVTGLSGWSDNLIRSVGLVCSSGAAPIRAVGTEGGSRFTLSCPDGSVAFGVTGRSGALVDSIGLACTPPATERLAFPSNETP